MKILSTKDSMNIDEYELYLYIYNLDTKKYNLGNKIKTYPKLPESDEE